MSFLFCPIITVLTEWFKEVKDVTSEAQILLPVLVGAAWTRPRLFIAACTCALLGSTNMSLTPCWSWSPQCAAELFYVAC